MDEQIIKAHNFEDALQRIDKFSKSANKELNVPYVKEKDWIFNHIATGEELNNSLSVLLNYIIDSNKLHNKTIEEFGQVYKAFDALDKDYIPAILCGIKASEKANHEVKETQADIVKLVENQRQTVEILKKFKDKLDSYQHLADVDLIWDELDILKNQVNKNFNDIDIFNRELDSLYTDVSNLSQFIKGISSYEHLNKIDLIWENENSMQETINQSTQTIEEQEKKIDSTETIIEKMQVQISNIEVSFSKKLKIAYGVAGTSVCLALAEFIIMLTRFI